MRTIIKWRWAVLVTMILLTVGLFLTAPNLAKQAEEAGSFQLADDADSRRAQQILEDAGASEETISLVLPLEEKITTADRTEINRIVEELNTLGKPVVDVLDPLESEDTESQLISKDKKTVLVPITVDGTEEEITDLADRIKADVLPKDRTIYLTGEALINRDVNTSAQEGLKKTELITVGLIFILLLGVFRSIVTPLIPLIAVGFSYLISQSLVAYFIDWFGFPVSNYTQTFMVAILFGIGTDYCILLLSRYKEELSAGHDVETSIVNTYKTAGRTLLVSGIAVFVGFAAIGFADFPIFKSSVAVAVGIFVLLIVLFTVIPFFMATLKGKLFWPSKKAASHSDSKLWARFGGLSIKNPLLAMAIVALVTVPPLFTYDESLSFNTIDEIGSKYDTVKGINAISKGFGEGESFPVKVVVKADEDIAREDTLPYAEKLALELRKVEGVETVRSITRPTGEVIEDLYLDNQLGKMADGLKEARDGLGEVKDGLTQVETNLNGVSGQLPSGDAASGGASQLQQAADGLGQVNTQLGLIGQSLQSPANAAQAAGQLTAISGQLTQIEQGISQAASGIASQGAQAGQLGSGLSRLAEGVGSANDGLDEVEGGLTQIANLLEEMGKAESIRGTGMFIPAGTLENAEFEPVLDRYTFGEETGLLFDVVLSDDPYSPEAIDTVERIKKATDNALRDTPLEDAAVAYGGISSINSDLNATSKADFTRTVTIIVLSLFVVLAVMFRSFIMPLFMIASLLLTYYTSVAIAELIFVNGLGYSGISWAVPFFGFVMLVALGIDYSIFLLDRFREETIGGLSTAEAMYVSMKKMGTVIITAAIILAGTFGAMIPSGVLSLVQIATIVITGLLLYGLIVLPLLIPAVTVSFGRGIWWPFIKKKEGKL
ncbi:MMPL family transporter [Exiguobacterium flavidum]|uniref:MMPL family transporter n=1 Tax=Exiguobacterium flavidum TaxID=2184695 RepID=UPI000DF7B636|nr:MMPL family transporter [Exiguobacterium flavidum]